MQEKLEKWYEPNTDYSKKIFIEVFVRKQVIGIYILKWAILYLSADMTGYFALKEPLHVIMFGKKIRTDVAEKGLSASQNSFLAISTININM